MARREQVGSPPPNAAKHGAIGPRHAGAHRQPHTHRASGAAFQTTAEVSRAKGPKSTKVVVPDVAAMTQSACLRIPGRGRGPSPRRAPHGLAAAAAFALPRRRPRRRAVPPPPEAVTQEDDARERRPVGRVGCGGGAQRACERCAHHGSGPERLIVPPGRERPGYSQASPGQNERLAPPNRGPHRRARNRGSAAVDVHTPATRLRRARARVRVSVHPAAGKALDVHHTRGALRPRAAKERAARC